jgi:hypothetical protein
MPGVDMRVRTRTRAPGIDLTHRAIQLGGFDAAKSPRGQRDHSACGHGTRGQ